MGLGLLNEELLNIRTVTVLIVLDFKTRMTL